MNLSLLLAGILAVTGSSSRPSLEWEQKVIVLHPTESEAVAVAHFRYRNRGEATVHLMGIHPSCGCTVAQSQQDAVSAGGEGEITARFQIGNRVGLQIKTVAVETNDPVEPRTVLTLKVVLPELLEIKPAFVYWKPGEILKPREIIVHPNKSRPVKSLTVTSSSPAFRTDTSRLPNGDFLIRVEPAEGADAAFATLTIRAGSSPKLFYANARVLTKPQR